MGALGRDDHGYDENDARLVLVCTWLALVMEELTLNIINVILLLYHIIHL